VGHTRNPAACENCQEAGLTFKHLKVNLLPQRVFFREMGVHTSDTMASASTATLTQTEQAQSANLEISAGLRRHDPDLIEQLIELYQHRLFRYLLFLTGSRDLSQDLFQETWLRVLERGSQYSGRARFDTWMFAIARNLMLDHTRKRGTVSLDEAMDPESGVNYPGSARPLEIAGDVPSPFDHFQSQEQAARIGQALLGLHPLYREVLVLRFHEEMSLEEIAQVSSAPLSTVKSRLYRGMAALKPVLEMNREVSL
jgi:RNA polymerase sigma-70 factor, ECF subfamily